MEENIKTQTEIEFLKRMYMEIKNNNAEKVYELIEEKQSLYKEQALIAMVAELLMSINELKKEIRKEKI